MSTHQTHSIVNPTHDTTLQKFLTTEYSTIRTSPLADITLHTTSTIFKAHRIVLSHYSPFFTTIFTSSPSTTHDIYLEGYTAPDIERALTFMYTGSLTWGPDVQQDKESLANVAESLHITSLSKFLKGGVSEGGGEVKGDESPRNGESPLSVWQKCSQEFEDDGGIEFDEVEEEEIDEDDYEYYEDRSKGKGSGGEEGSGSIGGVSKRRKQARPQRHKPTPPNSRSQSPTDIPSLPSSPEDHLQNSYDEDSRDPPRPKSPPLISPQPQHPSQNTHIPLPLNPQSSPLHNLPQPPPHYLFLRSIMNQTQIPPHANPPPHHPPPPHHFYPHAQMKKMQVSGPKGLWGKLMSKNPGGGQFTHGSSRAQHSAPRGGPPRAWSNQDLTEALHNVWNKKMTTSQASRIFGIPYNSLLMYVRGKYGKSLKLDLLKKGLDLALLEKQKKAAMQAQEQRSGQQNGSQQASPSSSSTRETANQRVDWGKMGGESRGGIGGGGGLFHSGLYYGGGGREQEIGK